MRRSNYLTAVRGTRMLQYRSMRWCLAFGTLFAAGCSTAPPFSLPDWGNPGTAATQQRRANRWDTFPETTPMGGDMDGARPREFVQSNPEPTRARWNFWPFAGQ